MPPPHALCLSVPWAGCPGLACPKQPPAQVRVDLGWTLPGPHAMGHSHRAWQGLLLLLCHRSPSVSLSWVSQGCPCSRPGQDPSSGSPLWQWVQGTTREPCCVPVHMVWLLSHHYPIIIPADVLELIRHPESTILGVVDAGTSPVPSGALWDHLQEGHRLQGQMGVSLWCPLPQKPPFSAPPTRCPRNRESDGLGTLIRSSRLCSCSASCLPLHRLGCGQGQEVGPGHPMGHLRDASPKPC